MDIISSLSTRIVCNALRSPPSRRASQYNNRQYDERPIQHTSVPHFARGSLFSKSGTRLPRSLSPKRGPCQHLVRRDDVSLTSTPGYSCLKQARGAMWFLARHKWYISVRQEWFPAPCILMTIVPGEDRIRLSIKEGP